MKAAMEHALEPWVDLKEFDEWSLDTGGENTYAFVGPDGGEPVAVVVVTDAFGRDAELDQYVALIAAAPDQNYHLKEIVGAADEYNTMPTKSLLTRLLAAIDASRAAIAKAEGRL